VHGGALAVPGTRLADDAERPSNCTRRRCRYGEGMAGGQSRREAGRLTERKRRAFNFKF